MKHQPSNELERVRIATALGFTFGRLPDFNWWYCFSPNGEKISGPWEEADAMAHKRPDFFNDANAALNICEFMTKKGAEILFLARKDWHVCMVLHCKTYTADANTLPSAICAAFCQYLDANEP
jgi:hypothetical protein